MANEMRTFYYFYQNNQVSNKLQPRSNKYFKTIN